MKDQPEILLTGTTGYIGGRLLPLLQEKGCKIRCMVRHPKLFSKPVNEHVELMQADALDKASLKKALSGIKTAYYFVQTLGRSEMIKEVDSTAAANFGQVASECGVKRIVYLGSLGPSYSNSRHLLRRHAVGHILRTTATHVQVIEFRASMVVGSGSLSFEMIHHLSEKQFVMIAPKWAYTKSQPIAIADLLNYLVKALDVKISGNPIFEIGGKDRASYADMIKEYAHQRDLKCVLIPLPINIPRFSSFWLGFSTPLYSTVSKKLIESAICPSTIHDPLASSLFGVQPMGIKEALASAICYEGKNYPETRWIDAVSTSAVSKNFYEKNLGTKIITELSKTVLVSPKKAFTPIRKIGGKRGWYFLNWIWRLKGIMDWFVGGVGFRQGRKSPEGLKVGETVDFWRVEQYEPDRRLKLFCEMKIPGRSWLEFIVEPIDGGSRIILKSIFDPFGASGVLYWYLLYPFHKIMLSGMLRNISKAAEKDENI